MSRGAADPRMICFTMLFEVYGKEAYAQLVLKQTLKGYPELDARDKSFITALFYGVITRTVTLDFMIEKKVRGSVSDLDPAIRTILRMGAWQILFSESIPDYAAVNTSVAIAAKRANPGGKSLVNAVLRAIASESDRFFETLQSEKPYVRFSLSREITGLLIKWYGEQKAESIADAFLGEAKVTARVNTLKCTRSELKEALEREGVECEFGRLTDQSLTLGLQGVSVDSLQAYREGLFMIQDEAAMLAGILAGPRPDDRVMDVCAAPGGKSGHMAELSSDRADILALDIHENRLKLIDENRHRLGIRSIRTGISDARNPDPSVTGPEGSYDIVLSDVPCSGLGLLKRKPDIRLTINYERIQALLEVQKDILMKSARYVKPGGVLVYSTCTINPDENGNRVDEFLRECPDFEPEPFERLLPQTLLSDKVHAEEAGNGRILLLPDTDGCDGFFIAKMRRIA